jgi:FdhD protein
MEKHDMYKKFRSFACSGHEFSPEITDLLLETPLEIIINGQTYILIMFTPQMIKELVVGFIFTEGIISKVTEIEKYMISPVRKEDGEEVIQARVTLSSNTLSPLATKRKMVSYSSCGICGTENYYHLKNGLTRVKSRRRFSMNVLKGFLHRMEEFQPLYQKTGGAHAAMLFDQDGNPVLHCEDMGRHNALDKVIGATLMKGIPRDDKVVFSSGRASLEMILKTARAGFPVFVAKSRPTSRAVEAAKFYNITLIDLAKDTNRIYSHVRRIKGF